MGISQHHLAKEIGVPACRIGEIVAGMRAITVDTGLRLSTFSTSEAFLDELQDDCDRAVTQECVGEHAQEASRHDRSVMRHSDRCPRYACTTRQSPGARCREIS